MRICMPIEADQGPESPLCDHFGSAPLFLIADSESEAWETVVNDNAHHAHGMCQPLQVLAGRRMDAIAVRGIGQGALQRLRAGGLTVYHATQATAAEVVAALKDDRLRPLGARSACGHHGAGAHGPGEVHGCGRHGGASGRGHRT